MSKIVVNKAFNKKYLVGNIKTVLIPNEQNNIDRLGEKSSEYHNSELNYVASIDVEGKTHVKSGKFFVVTAGFLSLIDKINTLLYNDTVTQLNSESRNRGTLNRLTAYNKSERTKALDRFKVLGYITDAEYEIGVRECEAFGQIKFDSISWNYNEQFDYYTMLHNTPLNLEKRWTNTENNPRNDELYIMTVLPASRPFNESSYSAYDRAGVETSCVKYYREDTGKFIYQLGYMAHTLTDRSGDGDIQFDYIDKIDYLDSLEISIKLPKEIS